MKTPETSRLFKRVTDPKTGVPHYVLTERACEYQQGFYFVNNSMTRDGRYLWFYATAAPVYHDMYRNLGYVDFLTDEIVLCYDALFHAATPYIDPDTGTAYFTNDKTLYKREPGKDKKTEKLCYVNIPGYVTCLATHLTRLSDKESFFLDIRRADFGGIQGVVNVKDGSFTEWRRDEQPINHGQINPVNDSLALCAYDSAGSLKDGKNLRVPYDEAGVYKRLCTVTSGGNKTDYAPRNNYATHEWWSADGKKIYYVNDLGIQRLDLTTGEHICIHECKPWHAHTTSDEKYYVFDEKVLDRYGGRWFRGCPAAVKFYNRETDREITVVTEMPENKNSPQRQNYYHIDPHPRFSENEKYVIFSTTELGGCDLAVASVEELVSLTK